MYERAGNNYFIAQTCKAGGGKIEGILIKKSSSKMSKLSGKHLYLERKVLIDFRIRKICFQDPLDDTKEIKFIDFKVIERVEKTNLDIWSHDTKVKFTNKFLVFTADRMYELFTKTRTERELWLEHFCKVIDLNAGMEVDFNKPSERYQKIQDAEKAGRSVTRLTKAPLIVEKEGFKEYKSNNMIFS